MDKNTQGRIPKDILEVEEVQRFIRENKYDFIFINIYFLFYIWSLIQTILIVQQYIISFSYVISSTSKNKEE